MKERPILFSGAMVRALLGGAKTQTRRVIDPRWHIAGESLDDHVEQHDARFGAEWLKVGPRPYGSAGDRLWVRETFAPCEAILANGTRAVVYRANSSDTNRDVKWKPSIFMPRWASRITLELTNVRVERVQQISATDAVAEGIAPAMRNEPTAVERYRDLWDSLNAKRGYSWDSNPWVWALTFRRVA